MKSLYLFSALCLSLITSVHAGMTMSPSVDAASGISIAVNSWLEVCPAYGMVPLKVIISNGSKQTHTWHFTVGNGYGMGGGVNTEADITVEAGRSGEMNVYAPVIVQAQSGYYYGNITFQISGYGVERASFGGLNISGSGRGARTSFTAMGKKLATKEWGTLKNKLEGAKSGSSGTDLMGCEVDIADAPEDWRGYTGLAQLWMDGSEWTSMKEASKAAMYDWVALGGRVYILSNEADSTVLHGAGQITRVHWDEKNFPTNAVVSKLEMSDTNHLGKQLNAYNDKSWPLNASVGELKLNIPLIFGFIIVFGTLVGPINLFWLAGVGRRQRLFWTTPLISLTGSAALVALMMFQDGLGGGGSRTVLGIFMPEQKKMLLTQEQISRTGVLLGRGFPKEEPSWMQTLNLRDNGSGYYNPASELRHTYTETPTFRSGDWFSSRAIQAQMMQAVRPSRAAIEWHPSKDLGGAPTVLSSMETPLTKVFIKDDAGKFWLAEDVGTGEKKTMKASSQAEFKLWLDDLLKKSSGPVVASAIEQLRNQPGYAFAEGGNASKIAVKSLSAIRWNQERVIFAGPYVKQP
ncbi:hypothetical protein BH11VER1_BH11VER1_12620 [soil metagenome]